MVLFFCNIKEWK